MEILRPEGKLLSMLTMLGMNVDNREDEVLMLASDIMTTLEMSLKGRGLYIQSSQRKKKLAKEISSLRSYINYEGRRKG